MLSFQWQSLLALLLCIFSYFSILLVPLILESLGHPCYLELEVYLPFHNKIILKYSQSISLELYAFCNYCAFLRSYTHIRWACIVSSYYFDLLKYRCSLLFLGMIYFFTLDLQPGLFCFCTLPFHLFVYPWLFLVKYCSGLQLPSAGYSR